MLKITPEPPAEESKSSRPGRNLPVITKDVIQLYICSSFKGKQTTEYGEPSELELHLETMRFWLKRVVPREFLSSLYWTRGFLLI
jgi:hypothetical protein